MHFLCDRAVLGYPRRHAAFPVRRTRLFCSCFVQLTLRAQTGTKHERQRAPHDGSLATVCGNSWEQLHCVYMENSGVNCLEI